MGATRPYVCAHGGREARVGALVRLLLCAVAALSLLFAAPARAEESAATVEYRIKAVVLYNFAKYVKWPESSFANAEEALRLCIVGENPFGDLFDEIKTKKAQGRPIDVLSLEASTEPAVLRSCHILFFKDKRARSAVEALKDSSVLTVSDLEADTIVRFVLKEEKVRFEIDVQKATAAGLVMSSQLLKLAIVKEN